MAGRVSTAIRTDLAKVTNSAGLRRGLLLHRVATMVVILGGVAFLL